jgi:nucleoside phosphorylase
MVSKEQHGSARMNQSQAHIPPISNASRKWIGMVAAFRWEVRPLLRKAQRAERNAPPQQPGGGEANEGKRRDSGISTLLLDETPVVVAVSGAGAENSLRLAQRLAAEFPLCGLASLGFAGGLVPGLQTGDVVFADCVIDESNGERFPCDNGLLPVRFARRGNLLSADSVIISSEEKHRLGEMWQAVAVDMESSGVARAAAAAGLPFCAVKSITDSAEESLSIDFGRCRREDKGFSFWAIGCQGLTTLHGARDLWRLARNARRAARGLAAALGRV